MVENPKRELTLIPRKLVKLMRGDSYALQWVNARRPGSPSPVPARSWGRSGCPPTSSGSRC